MVDGQPRLPFQAVESALWSGRLEPEPGFLPRPGTTVAVPRPAQTVDFFVVPTITYRILFVFVVLAHERCRIVHFNVTAHPTAE